MIEPIREPTPSVSLEGDSKENSKIDSREESQEKHTKESKKSSQNGKNRSRKLEKDIVQSTKKTAEQTSASKQVEIHSTSTQPIKPLVIDLEEEWDKFNKRLHIEEQMPELQTPQQKTTQGITTKETINTQEVEQISVTPTSEIVLKIEEISPLDMFYSPQQSC